MGSFDQWLEKVSLFNVQGVIKGFFEVPTGAPIDCDNIDNVRDDDALDNHLSCYESCDMGDLSEGIGKGLSPRSGHSNPPPP